MTIDHKYGVPTVAVHTDRFEAVVRSVTQVSGMPYMRQVFVPQPIMGKTPQQLRSYVDGKHVKRVRGDRITTFSLRRPKGKNTFVLKIVTHAANGQKTISVRTYHRCTKTNPDTHTIKP